VTSIINVLDRHRVDVDPDPKFRFDPVDKLCPNCGSGLVSRSDKAKCSRYRYDRIPLRIYFFMAHFGQGDLDKKKIIFIVADWLRCFYADPDPTGCFDADPYPGHSLN
jgi:hypothetical protein